MSIEEEKKNQSEQINNLEHINTETNNENKGDTQEESKEKKISYTLRIEYQGDLSIAEDEDVLIIGEFNQWNPEPMQKKENNLFTYEKEVIKGF